MDVLHQHTTHLCKNKKQRSGQRVLRHFLLSFIYRAVSYTCEWRIYAPLNDDLLHFRYNSIDIITNVGN